MPFVHVDHRDSPPAGHVDLHVSPIKHIVDPVMVPAKYAFPPDPSIYAPVLPL